MHKVRIFIAQHIYFEFSLEVTIFGYHKHIKLVVIKCKVLPTHKNFLWTVNYFYKFENGMPKNQLKFVFK